jgi:hypothetical protein
MAELCASDSLPGELTSVAIPIRMDLRNSLRRSIIGVLLSCSGVLHVAWQQKRRMDRS